jgi:hypothetical protein
MDKNKSAAKETAPRKKRGQISPPSFLILHDVWIRGDKNANDFDLNELLSLSLSQAKQVAMPKRKRERARRNKLNQTLHLAAIHRMMKVVGSN